MASDGTGPKIRAWRLLVETWGAAGALVGLVVATDLIRSNQPFGLSRDELVSVGVVNGLALLIPMLILGIVALLIGAWIERRSERSFDVLPVHAALAAGVVCGWFVACLGNQADADEGTRLAARIAAPFVAVVVAVVGTFVLRRMLAVPAWRVTARAAVVLACAILFLGSLTACLAASDRDDTPRVARLSEKAGFPALSPPLERAPGRGRVILLGIDALDRTMLDPLLAEGRLPNFARLEREGVSAVLDTQIPTGSPRIWNTVATGRTPPDHGIAAFGVIQFPSIGIERVYRPRAMNLTRPILHLIADGWRKPVSGHERRVKAIWDLCSEAGITVGVVGWWASWPAEPVNGFLVSDHMYYDSLAEREWRWRDDERTTQGHWLCYPEEVIAEVVPFHRSLADARLEDLSPFVNLTDDDRARFGELIDLRRREKAEQAVRTIGLGVLKDEFYGNAALALFDKHQPEVMLAYLNAVDTVSHAIYGMTVPDALERGHSPEDVARFGGSLGAIVERADAWLGEWLARMDDDTTLIVISDHGFQKEPCSSRPDGCYGHYNAPPGVLFALGKNVPRGATLERAHVDDVARTMLHFIGLPLSEELCGELLEGVFEPDFLAANPPRTIPTYECGHHRLALPPSSSEQDDAMMDNLRALGYVR